MKLALLSLLLQRLWVELAGELPWMASSQSTYDSVPLIASSRFQELIRRRLKGRP
jgi:hypothetical protein